MVFTEYCSFRNGQIMAFMSGDFEYVAGNLVKDPILGRFPAKDGMYDEVV